MIFFHLTAYGLAAQLEPFVRQQGILMLEHPLPDALSLVTFVSIVTAMTGGALAVSAWVKSNGVPILCGLLTPLLIVSLMNVLAWLLEIPSWGDAFRIRIATSMFVLGIALGSKRLLLVLDSERTMTAPIQWRSLKVIVVPSLIFLVAFGLLAFDGVRQRVSQLSQFELPTDHSARAMLEFMRRADGSVQIRNSFLESSNLKEVCQAIEQAYAYVQQDPASLSSIEKREADFYR